MHKRGMICGTPEVSTHRQSVDAQVKQLRAAGAEKGFGKRRAARAPTARGYAARSASLKRRRV